MAIPSLSEPVASIVCEARSATMQNGLMVLTPTEDWLAFQSSVAAKKSVRPLSVVCSSYSVYTFQEYVMQADRRRLLWPHMLTFPVRNIGADICWLKHVCLPQLAF